MTYALGIDYQMVGLAFLAALDYMIDDRLLIVIIGLRQQYVLGTARNAAPQRYIARMTPHNLYYRTPLVRT